MSNGPDLCFSDHCAMVRICVFRTIALEAPFPFEVRHDNDSSLFSRFFLEPLGALGGRNSYKGIYDFKIILM